MEKASDGSKRSSGTWVFYLSWPWDVAHRTHPGTIEWTHGCVNLCTDGLKVFEVIGGSQALSQSCFHSEHILLDHSEFLSVLRIHLILTFSWNKPNYRIPHTPNTRGTTRPGRRSISTNNKGCDAADTSSATAVPVTAAAASRTTDTMCNWNSPHTSCLEVTFLATLLRKPLPFYAFLGWAGRSTENYLKLAQSTQLESTEFEAKSIRQRGPCSSLLSCNFVVITTYQSITSSCSDSLHWK